MKRRYLTTAVVGVIFVGLVTWVLVAERGRVPEKGEHFALQLTDISQIKVDAKDYKYTMVRRGEQWWITAPFEGLVAEDDAKQVVQAIATLKPQKREGLNLQDPEFGLDDPQATVTITYRGNRGAVIQLGKQSTLGSVIFATISNEPGALFLLDQTFITDVNKDPEKMREKKLVPELKLERVKQLRLQREGETVTAALVPLATEKTWRITEPRALRADRAAVDAVISSISMNEAVAFRAYTPENLAATGLDKPRITATVTQEGQSPITIYLGGTGTETVQNTASYAGAQSGSTEEPVVYVTRTGRPEILAMKAAYFEEMDKGLLALRDKRILDLKQDQIESVRVQREEGLSFSMMKTGENWQVTAPKAGKADPSAVSDTLFSITQLEALAYPVEDEASPDLDKYGLRLPRATLTIRVAGQSQPINIWVGGEVPDQPERYYARTSLANAIYEIDASLLRGLPVSADTLVESSSGGSEEAPPRTAP